MFHKTWEIAFSHDRLISINDTGRITTIALTCNFFVILQDFI